MVDDQKKDTGEGDAYSKMLMDAGDISADMAAIILGMRSNLLEGGMSPAAADAGALQFQNYLLTTGADAHRASLQPKRGGIFG